MGYLLLTGATGLLGRYLLRDVLRAGLQVAALVRGDVSLGPRRRIDAMLRDEEAAGEPPTPRPVVLQGDLLSPGCGLDPSAVAWIARHCTAVIHCAASLSFQESASGEPHRTNVQGTERLLELCRLTGIRNWHQVSTSYIAGRRSGRVYEHETDVGQTPSNVYERSKLESEQLVRRSTCLDRVTVFRPAIIVGDFQTGATSSFHGFYRPLQLGLAMAKQAIDQPRHGDDVWLRRLGMRGDERKNLVPVDWVSAVMSHIIRRPEHHGKTYHLTSGKPVSVREMDLAIAEAIRDAVAARRRSSRPAAPAPADLGAEFDQGMEVYRDYFRDDPDFDATNTRAAAAHLPCPALDHQALLRLARYAIAANFGWPRPRPAPAKFDVTLRLEQFGLAPSWSTSGALGLDVVGPGGGQWQVAFEADRPCACGFGWRENCSLVAHFHVHTFEALARRRLTVAQAIAQGRVVVFGAEPDLSTAERWLSALIRPARGSCESSRRLARAPVPRKRVK